jgi:hypothetical protein
MKVLRVLLPSFLLLSIVLFVLGRHVPLPRAQTIEEAPAACCSEEAPRQMEFPYYSLEDGFNSTLLLVSDSPKSLDFVMAVRSRSGQTLLAPAMTIQPQEKLPIDLRGLLAQLGADTTGDFAEGSVSVYFNGTIHAAGRATHHEQSRAEPHPGIGDGG